MSNDVRNLEDLTNYFRLALNLEDPTNYFGLASLSTPKHGKKLKDENESCYILHA